MVLARWRVEVQDFGGVALLERLDERLRISHVLTDVVAVIVVVRQGGIHIGECDARKLGDDLIRRQPMDLMPDDNILDADKAAGDARFAPAGPWGTHDVLDKVYSSGWFVG